MNVWSRARSLAEKTPPHRNRYLDFLRAAAILVVVFGHWLVQAPYMTDTGLAITTMLGVVAWSHLLTWAVQVMPVFFIVGGYANAASWEAAVRDGRGYASWVQSRLARLVAPVVPLLIVWACLAIDGPNTSDRYGRLSANAPFSLICTRGTWWASAVAHASER